MAEVNSLGVKESISFFNNLSKKPSLEEKKVVGFAEPVIQAVSTPFEKPPFDLAGSEAMDFVAFGDCNRVSNSVRGIAGSVLALQGCPQVDNAPLITSVLGLSAVKYLIDGVYRTFKDITNIRNSSLAGDGEGKMLHGIGLGSSVTMVAGSSTAVAAAALGTLAATHHVSVAASSASLVGRSAFYLGAATTGLFSAFFLALGVKWGILGWKARGLLNAIETTRLDHLRELLIPGIGETKEACELSLGRLIGSENVEALKDPNVDEVELLRKVKSHLKQVKWIGFLVVVSGVIAVAMNVLLFIFTGGLWPLILSIIGLVVGAMFLVVDGSDLISRIKSGNFSQHDALMMKIGLVFSIAMLALTIVLTQGVILLACSLVLTSAWILLHSAGLFSYYYHRKPEEKRSEEEEIPLVEIPA